MLLIAIYFLLGQAQYAWLNITAMPLELSLLNDLPFSCEICYVTLHEQSPQAQWCYSLHYKEEAELPTFTGHLFTVRCGPSFRLLRLFPSNPAQLQPRAESTEPAQRFLLSGQFNEHLVESFLKERTIRVVSSVGDLSKVYFEPVWRDAMRVSAYRHGRALCFCGVGNQTTTNFVNVLAAQSPHVIYGPSCECPTTTATKSRYDFLLPANHAEGNPLADAETLTDCSLYDTDSVALARVRVHWISGVCSNFSRLSFKNRLWHGLRQFYGVARARLLMPFSFAVREVIGEQSANEVTHSESIRSRITRIQSDSGLEQDQAMTFIVKNPILHSQKGVLLSSENKLAQRLEEGYEFATEFLTRPYLLNGYKLNMRRYLLLVCTAGRLRGYVHDNGKNYYTPKPYKESWETEQANWEDDKDAMTTRMSEVITTAYVPEAHYDEIKPMTGSELFKLFNAQQIDYAKFERSMHVRLALSIHMDFQNVSLAKSSSGGGEGAEPASYTCAMESTPACLENAIRSTHLGCDFHVDRELTGYNSRLFECNKGPDMTIHNERDGILKLEVASDMASLLGFNEDFDDSARVLKRYRLSKVYDSQDFDVEAAFAFLESLKDLAPRDQLKSPKKTVSRKSGGHVEL